MLISRHRKFIFIHIYKNAGTSITRALRPLALGKWESRANRMLEMLGQQRVFTAQPYPSHITATELIRRKSKPVFDSCFSFAVVRNPWDWQVSLYKYVLQTGHHPQHELISKMKGFREYIQWRCEHEVQLQKSFLYSKDNQLLVDFVARFENLDSDFQSICERIGVSASLPMLNVSNTDAYQDLYDENTRELVAQAFKDDITTFGYRFSDAMP